MTSRTKSRNRFPIAAFLASLALFASACGDSISDDGELTADDAWARPTANVADTAAFYVQVDNGTASSDELLGGSSDRCAMVHLHRTEMQDGVMSMLPAEPGELTVEPGASLLLEPGGLHVMCMGVTSPLEAGETVDVELNFKEAGALDVSVSVEDR